MRPISDQTCSERHSARIEYSTGIAALEAITGRDAALAIINACAGRTVLVRAIPLPDDELSMLIGLEAAQAVADELLVDDDGDSRDFFINQPPVLAQVPGDAVVPTYEALATPRDQALTGTLAAIEEACGRDAALKIIAHYGGRRLYVPWEENLRPDSAIAEVIGLEAARAFCAAFQSAGQIDIPTAVYGSSAVRRDTGMKMLREGYSPADVTRLLKVSRAAVFIWARKIKEEQK